MTKKENETKAGIKMGETANVDESKNELRVG